MEGKMLIKATKDGEIEMECKLENVNLLDKFHILYCMEQVLKMNDFEIALYTTKMGRGYFKNNGEQTLIDLSNLEVTND